MEKDLKKVTIKANDIVNRGYPLDYKVDLTKEFYKISYKDKFDFIITNPPFNCAQQIIENSFELLKEDRFQAFLLKLNFLEGQKRKEFFKKFPPKYVLVCSHRVNILRNGKALDDNGKRLSNTMAFAWFVWQKYYYGSTELRWI